MSTESQELLQICEQLPPAKRAQVTDFARFMLAQNQDEAWEATIDDPRPRPRLKAFMKAALEEGSEPLDPETL
jgi:hypothetical protein